MSLVRNVLRSHVVPGQVLARLRDQGADEGRALAYLMGGCGLIFVGQLPRLARAAHLDPSVALDARIGGALFGWLFIMPLVFYLLAAMGTGIARLARLKIDWYDGRLAAFWAVLAASPGVMLLGLYQGFAGQGPATDLLSVLVLVVFHAIWIGGMYRLGTTRTS